MRKPDPTELLLMKLALPALVGALWVYRRYLREQSAHRRTEQVALGRQYEPIDPESGHPDYVRGAGDFILRFHEWAKLALLLAGIAVGIVAVNEPLVRIILAFTAAAMVVIVMAWGYRRRESRRVLEAEDRAMATKVEPAGPAI